MPPWCVPTHKATPPWCVVTVISCVSLFMLLLLSYSLPFSQLYHQLHSYNELYQQVEKSSDLRTARAKRYFGQLNPQESTSLYMDRLRQKKLNFLLGIITVKRTKESETHNSFGYLLQSASMLDQIFKQSDFFNSSVLFICNVDNFPEKHSDAVSSYQFLPYTERYGHNSMGIPMLNFPGTNTSFGSFINHRDKYQKETFDYVFCLLSAAALGPQFVILVEDDSLPHKDFPLVLEHLIHTRLKVINREHSRTNNFAYLKMYFPAKWQGFGFELSKLVDLVSWVVLGGLLFILVNFDCSLRARFISFSINKVFLTGCLITMITCWLIGRQNINELRRISKHFYRVQSSEDCCTQAMLYPVDVVGSLTSYLIVEGKSQHTDLAISDFSALNGLTTYQVEPSLFLHVGLHTTLDLRQKHPEEFIIHL